MDFSIIIRFYKLHYSIFDVELINFLTFKIDEIITRKPLLLSQVLVEELDEVLH